MTRTSFAALVTVAALCHRVDATAQSAAAGAGGQRSLDVSLDAFGGWDWNLAQPTVEPVVVADFDRDATGTLAGVNGSMAASIQTPRFSLNATADASARWHSTLMSDIAPGYGGTVTLSSPVAERRRWSVSERLSYAPLSVLPFLSGGFTAVQAPVVDYQISGSTQFVSETSASMGVPLSRRGQVGVAGSYGVLDDPSDPESGRIRRWTAGASYSHQTTRYATFDAGYSLSRGGVGERDPLDVVSNRNASTFHNLNLGMAYERPLSFSRRTTVSGRLGSTLVELQSAALEYRIVGDAGISHLIGRTWSIQGAYNRNVKFVDAFLDPVFLDAVTAQTAGQVSSRVALRFLANVSKGSAGGGGAGSDLSTSSFSGQLRVGLLPSLALMTEYFLFQSEFGTLVNLPNAFGRDYKRHGVRIGLSFGTALLGTRR